MSNDPNKSGISRRKFLQGLGGTGVATVTLAPTLAKAAVQETGRHGAVIRGPGLVTITLKINGKTHRLELEPRVSLLDAIRDHLGYTGTKRVCNRGQCGACTVILDGHTVLACSMLALDADGSEIETIEGLADGDKLHPVQQAFVENDAMQCGFCTPGFVMSSVSLLRENPNPTQAEIKAGVSGNLCRCGTYPHIFKAVAEAAEVLKKGG